MIEQHLLTTESERYFINASEKIIAFKEISWRDIFKALDESEELWREWLFNGLLSPFSKHINDPLCSFTESNNDQKDDPSFLIGSSYGKVKKYRFVMRHSIYLDWFNAKGMIPPVKGESRSKFSSRFDIDAALRSLPLPKINMMWRSILLDKGTRVSTSCTKFESSLRYHVDPIRELLQHSMHSETPLDFLSRIFHINVKSDGKEKARGPLHYKRELRLSIMRFIAFLANKEQILLPAKILAQNVSGISHVYTGFMKGYAIRHFAGHRKLEIEAGMHHLSVDHKGLRQLRLADIFILFCASNYGSSDEFAPEFLAVAQAATPGHFNNMRPYFNGIKDYHRISHEEYRKWDATLRGRNSKSFSEGPFSIFSLPPNVVLNAFPVHVKKYEKATKLKFPEGIDSTIRDWSEELDRLIRKLPRQDLSSTFMAAKHWLFFLCTLPPERRPKTFADIERETHIKNESNSDTIVGHFERNGLSPGHRLRDIHQLMQIWQAENPEVIHLPIVPSLDWKNREKSFRTKRKAIPSLIIETLIEENARECEAGIPYSYYRNWILNRGKLTSNMRLDGKPTDYTIPSVPAVIDCILNLGMRSSSARWIDSGESDEFTIDYDSVKETLNTHQNARAGIQAGFLQRMQVGPTQWVPSFLMLRNKTASVHEIPYAPKQLVERLQFIKRQQIEFNPISAPTYAVDDDEMSNLEDVALVYPLFRDPTNADAKAVSYAKVVRWWEELLRICEPILNEKRKIALGSDCEYYHFFDSNNKPLWDIHSIRVTVVTALLEMGVPPTIVQHLVGHKSPAMTLHYQAVDARKVGTALTEALEARRMAAAQAIGNARDMDELEEAIDDMLGGLANGISGKGFWESAEYAMANGKNLKSGTAAFSVFSHGICPGGDCSQGGEKKGNFHMPVHRDMACARCRFRITGPAFLAGLELNANILMNEISESSRREEKLNAELLQLSRAGKPTAILESRVSQEQRYRDEVWADWAAEYRTIRECLDMAHSFEDNDLPALPRDITISLSERSRLPMLQGIIGKSKLIYGSSLDLPPGLVEARNDMLWEIASKSGDIASYLISLDKESRDAALHQFGEIICNYADEIGEDLDNLIQDQSKLSRLKHMWKRRDSEGNDYEE